MVSRGSRPGSPVRRCGQRLHTRFPQRISRGRAQRIPISEITTEVSANLRRIVCAMMAAGLAMANGAAVAQKYPEKAVRIVVPFTPGGGADILARLVAQKLTDDWGRNVVVENRAGGGSVIGAELVARSTPDGYTLLVNANPHTSNPALVAKLPFDTMRDFAAVTMLGSAPLLLTVHPSLPLRNVRELIAFAKARPNQLAYGSSGNGGPQHLATELFKHMTGVGMLHVPYKGSTPVLVDLIGGQVQLSFAGMLAVLPHIKAGKLRPLAVSSARRSQANPEFPTLAESGVPGFEMMAWWGVFAPAGIPQAIVVKVQGDVARALASADLQERLFRDGVEPVGNTPEEFTAFVQREIEIVAKLVRTAGIKPN